MRLWLAIICGFVVFLLAMLPAALFAPPSDRGRSVESLTAVAVLFLPSMLVTFLIRGGGLRNRLLSVGMLLLIEVAVMSNLERLPDIVFRVLDGVLRVFGV